MSLIALLILFSVWIYWISCVCSLIEQNITLEQFFVRTAVLLPFYSVSFGVLGFQLSIYKFLPCVIFLYAVLISKRVRLPLIIIGAYFSIITICCLVYALYANLFDESVGLGRDLNGIYAHVVVQHTFFILSILQIWAVGFNERMSAHLIFRSYVIGCLILVFIGYLQLVSFNYGGPWFEFWWLNDALNRTAEGGMAQHAFDKGFYRMSSLGGEPRHFASILSLGVLLLLYLRDTLVGQVLLITGKSGIITLCVLFSGIILSFSSSGLGALLLCVITYMLFTGRFAYSIICALLPLVLINLNNKVFYNITYKLKSIDMIFYAAPKDAFAIRVLQDNVAGLLFGFGTNLAEFFSPEVYLASNSFATFDSTVSPTSPLLQILVNGGVVGFFLVIWYVYKESYFLDKYGVAVGVAILASSIMGSSLLLTLGMFFLAVLMSDGRTRLYNSAIE